MCAKFAKCISHMCCYSTLTASGKEYSLLPPTPTPSPSTTTTRSFAHYILTHEYLTMIKYPYSLMKCIPSEHTVSNDRVVQCRPSLDVYQWACWHHPDYTTFIAQPGGPVLSQWLTCPVIHHRWQSHCQSFSCGGSSVCADRGNGAIYCVPTW